MSTKVAAKKKLHPLINEVLAQSQLTEMNQVQSAARGNMSLDELIKTADEWQKQGKTTEIDHLYSAWIGNTDSPYKFIACFNYGVLLAGWGRDNDAIVAYETAIRLNPALAHAKINLGLTLERQGSPEKALAQWREVAEQSVADQHTALDMRTTALNHIGRLLEIQREYADAEAALAESLTINPQQADAIHHWFHLRQKQCKWPTVEAIADVSENMIIRAMSPLAVLAHEDDPALQMYIADRIVKEKFTYQVTPLAGKRIYPKKRKKIGYLSGDLCTHAVGLLLPEIFELHHREQFEIYAYDYSREDGTPLRQRYKDATDHFIPINHLNDIEAAQKIREHEIDILVDLHGLSQGLRAGIIAQRPSPIQMTYLGYIGDYDAEYRLRNNGQILLS